MEVSYFVYTKSMICVVFSFEAGYTHANSQARNKTLWLETTFGFGEERWRGGGEEGVVLNVQWLFFPCTI